MKKILSPDELACKILQSACTNHPEFDKEVFREFYELARCGYSIVGSAKKACRKIRRFSRYDFADDVLVCRVKQLHWNINCNLDCLPSSAIAVATFRQTHTNVMLWLRPDLIEEYLPF